MLIIPVLMAVSFGLLISLVGLFALAKTKKRWSRKDLQNHFLHDYYCW